MSIEPKLSLSPSPAPEHGGTQFDACHNPYQRDCLAYYKEDIGGYEPIPIPWAVGGFPQDFNFQLLDSNWGGSSSSPNWRSDGYRHGAHRGSHAHQRPRGIYAGWQFQSRGSVRSPELFLWAPDSMHLALQPAAEPAWRWRNGSRTAGSPSIPGRWAFAASGRPHRDIGWVHKHALEPCGKHYTITWPHEEHESGRPCRVSPLYQRLKNQGACFGEKLIRTGSLMRIPEKRGIFTPSGGPTGSGLRP